MTPRPALLGLVALAVLVGAYLIVRPADGSGESDDATSSTSAEQVAIGVDPCPEFTPPSDAPAGDSAGDSAGDKADVLPDLSFPCLNGGEQVALAGGAGTPMVLNVWGSWCPPCRDELPYVEELHQKAGTGLVVLGVDVLDSRQSAASYTDEAGLTFPSVFDAEGAIVDWSGVAGPPFTLFVRADGTIAHRAIGPVPSYSALRDLVKQHLGVEVQA